MSRKLCVFLLLIGLAGYGRVNELVNPGLEADANGSVSGWHSIRAKNPPVVDRQFKRSGENSLRGSYAVDGLPFGVMQSIKYETPNQLPIVFGGWSKSAGVKSTQEYCIYLDVFFADGTKAYGIKALWCPLTHDWEYAYAAFKPWKPVEKILYHVLLRNQAEGTIWIDDLELLRPESLYGIPEFVQANAMSPGVPKGVRVRSWFFNSVKSGTCRLEGVSGEVLASREFSGRMFDWIAEVDGVAAFAVFSIADNALGRELRIPVRQVSAGGEALPAVRVWTADSMSNISPLTKPGVDAPSSLLLEAAKGERESGQVLVTSAQSPLSQVEVVLSTLSSPSGESFRGLFYWERVGYVARANPVMAVAEAYPEIEYWLPDPLLPARPFDVPANATQSVWVTVMPSRDAKAGTYRGTITVKADSKDYQVPIEVKVFDFELPKTFSMPTSYSIMDGWLKDAYPDADFPKLRREAWDMMLDHRLNPDDISRTSPPEIGELLYARERGMNRFNILNLVPKPKPGQQWVPVGSLKAYTPELISSFWAELDPYIAELRKHDLIKYAYIYGFDERTDEFYPLIADIYAQLKKRYPDVPFLTTSMMYKSLRANPERTDCGANDWYCPLLPVYDGALSAKLRAQGHQVWWYVCGTLYPYANFSSIELPFVDARLIAWMTFQHRADGFLYWVVNYWLRSGKLSESTSYQIDFIPTFMANVHAAGQLMYPGPNGPLPSIRLANIRDGSEDYDYLVMASELGRELCDRLIPDLKSFNRDPAAVRQARRELAAKIESK